MFEISYNNSKELLMFLREWRESYTLGFPQVPDDVFDHYKNILQKTDEDLYDIFINEIGITPKRNKEILPFILGSLKNVFLDNIMKWLEKRNGKSGFVITPKLDGIALETEWINCELQNAWLRGDHYVGENVTEKAKQFLPHKLKISPENKQMFKLKSEGLLDRVILSHEILLNCEPSEIGYKNKRNGVAGIMHRDDDKHLKYLYCLAHGWLNSPSCFINELERLTIMNNMIDTVDFIFVSDIDQVVTTATKIIETSAQYDKDGAVITINEGYVEHILLPENKIAFKLNKQISQTIVKSIEWNVSRTNKIIPLVYVEPVELGGVTIGKCTAFNAKFIKDKQLGPNSIIKICRSGDVIPYIEEVLESTNIKIPTKCPSCNSSIVWDENSVHIECTNLNCPPVIQKKIAHFFIHLGLEFFSEKMISSLNCNSIIDVYNLKKEDILKLDSWGEKSSIDFVKRIQEIKKTTPDKLFASLGISGIGQTMAKSILEYFDFNKLISMSGVNDYLKYVDDLCKIKGIANKRAISILKGLNENISLLQQLSELGVTTDHKSSGVLQGLKFEFTGAVSKPRKEFVSWIENNGGQHTSISNCNYLICNQESNSSKYVRAKKDNISIITEKELVELYLERKRKLI